MLLRFSFINTPGPFISTPCYRDWRGMHTHTHTRTNAGQETMMLHTPDLQSPFQHGRFLALGAKWCAEEALLPKLLLLLQHSFALSSRQTQMQMLPSNENGFLPFCCGAFLGLWSSFSPKNNNPAAPFQKRCCFWSSWK